MTDRPCGVKAQAGGHIAAAWTLIDTSSGGKNAISAGTGGRRDMLQTLQEFGLSATRWRTWTLMGNQDIRMRYKRSLLGPFWISLSLAVLVIGLALLYGQIFMQPFDRFLRWLCAGFVVWWLFSGMISEGCNLAIEAEQHLRSLAVPIPVLAARMVYRNWIVFLHNAVVVVVMLVLLRLAPGIEILWIVPGLILLLAIGYFAAVALGPLCLRFRDVQQVIANVLQISFFMTPILWMPSQGRVNSAFVERNPLYHMIEVVRAPILGQAPTASDWLYAGTLLAALVVIALVALTVSRKRLFLWL